MFTKLEHAPVAERLETVTSSDWTRSLAAAVRSESELRELLRLPPLGSSGQFATSGFPLLVPRSYIARMDMGNPEDPLLLQVLPTALEHASPVDFLRDPVGDLPAKRAPGLLHKYHGRALLIMTGACAVHCRYCFRQHYPYSGEPHGLEQWKPALAAIQNDASLSEIILSGGDPLMLRDTRLARLISELADIPHIRRLRIHTRLPIVLPDRVTAELVEMLTSTRLTSVVVVHANHARELVNDCAAALRRLTLSGIPVLNQAVLLRNINDTVAALAELSERSIALGVVPYYLHQLDKVAGAAHFEVDVAIGRALIGELRALLPGYLVPQYVTEVAGDTSKRPLA